MRPHEFRWEKPLEASLDPKSIEGIVSIRGPHPRGVLEYAEIGATPTRCAGFDADPREGLFDVSKQGVERTRLSMWGVPSLRITRLMNISVHIPLKIGNGVRRKQ